MKSMFLLALSLALVFVAVQGDNDENKTTEPSILDKASSALSDAASKFSDFIKDGADQVAKQTKDMFDDKSKSAMEETKKEIDRTKDDLVKGTNNLLNKALGNDGSILEISNTILYTVISLFFIFLIFF